MRFYSGDYVRVAKDLGRSMSHFQSDCDAVVIGSYGDRFGGEDHNSYTIHIRGRGQVSWYYGEQLELLERARHDLIEAWEAEEEAEEKLKSDIDWIFANGEEVIHTPHGASINTLAACLGIKNMWGLNGEGITYYHNFLLTMMAAKEYLKTGDKAGFLAFAQKVNHDRP